jgi:hypothetical protein
MPEKIPLTSVFVRTFRALGFLPQRIGMLFQNFSFEETGKACPATYKNHRFAVRRTRP